MSAKILIVDDSATMRHAIGSMVRRMQREPIMASSGEEALALCAREQPGIVLLDVNMPGMDGYETARRIRAANPEDWVPIIFLSASEEDQDLARAIESGGDDYLVKPVSQVVLSAKIRALQRLESMRHKLTELTAELSAANRRLEVTSQSDGLTGIANRRHFDGVLGQQIAVARRQHLPLSLALCDVDFFKAFNDHYGHLGGDECLRKVAEALRTACRRETDLVARYGGEEFALVLPATGIEGARIVTERARRNLAELAIGHAHSDVSGHVTISIGMSEFSPARDARPEDLIGRTDDALYRAKHTGRDRVVVLAAEG